MNRTHAGVGAAFLLPVGIVAVLAVSPAEAEDNKPPAPPPPPAVKVEDKVPAEVIEAMERDLGLSPDEARARIESDEAAGRTERRLRKKLGRSFGGSYITPDGQSLVVTVTDEAKAKVVEAAGAIPKIVENNQATLDNALEDVGKIADDADSADVTGWYVDPETNKVVVETRGSVGEAESLVEGSGADTDTVEVVKSKAAPELLSDLRGADPFVIPDNKNGVCSVGFPVEGGYITAGHCGTKGMETVTPGRESLGQFNVSSFPGNDYAFVSTTESWKSTPLINNYAGGSFGVTGVATTESVIKGAAVCRSGITTGWRCGTVEQKDRTVVYKDKGTVDGLTETTACAEAGDSGGPFVMGQKAIGITSGGAGTCPAATETNNSRTYFQPIQEILEDKNIPSAVSASERQEACQGYDKEAKSSEEGIAAGGSATPLAPYYYVKTAGTHSACLAGPEGADFDMYLQWFDGKAWTIVGRGKFAGSTEVISWAGQPGYYAWTIRAISGSGPYEFDYSIPK